MAQAPLPEKLPGEFYVIEYRRAADKFKLYVDDGDKTTYDLGGNIPRIMLQFRLWGLKEIGNSSIDIAKEFGAANVGIESGKVIPMFERPKQQVFVTHYPDLESEAHGLPSLTAF